MNGHLAKKAVEISRAAGHCFVATVSADGVPHLTVASKLDFDPADDLVVTEWFCPETMENLNAGNRQVSVVAWDPAKNNGFQLTGLLKEEEDLEVLDGLPSGLAAEENIPQVRRSLKVRVDRILEFKSGPHSDIEPF